MIPSPPPGGEGLTRTAACRQPCRRTGTARCSPSGTYHRPAAERGPGCTVAAVANTASTTLPTTR